jgi:hypothetical protein
MKKLFVAFAILFAGLSAEAQVKVNINIGVQPSWGPTGYNYAGYYYFPEINVYYDVMDEQYVYFNNRQWIHSNRLPGYFGKPDLFRMYKVVINERNPYLNNRIHVSQYAKYKNYHNQQVIRDSREEKYFESKYHPKHSQWESGQMSQNRYKKDNDPRLTGRNDYSKKDDNFRNENDWKDDKRNSKESKGRGSKGSRS